MLTLKYSLDANDFLSHQLYVASKSAQVKKRRMRTRLVVPIIYVLIGTFLFFQKKEIFAILFLVFALCWFFLYPLRDKNLYRKYYQKFIQENYKERIGRKTEISFYDDHIFSKDIGAEGKIQMSELTEIIELQDVFLIRLKTGVSVIIPKNKIPNPKEIAKYLKNLANKLKINFNQENDWVWK